MASASSRSGEGLQQRVHAVSALLNQDGGVLNINISNVSTNGLVHKPCDGVSNSRWLSNVCRYVSVEVACIVCCVSPSFVLQAALCSTASNFAFALRRCM